MRCYTKGHKELRIEYADCTEATQGVVAFCPLGKLRFYGCDEGAKGRRSSSSWVQSFLVSFQTRSIGLRSGL